MANPEMGGSYDENPVVSNLGSIDASEVANGKLEEEQGAIQEESQEREKNLKKDTENMEEIREVLTDEFENLVYISNGLEKRVPGYDVFSQFIINADSKIHNAFLDFSNGEKMISYIESTGKFPVNEFEFQQIIVGKTVSQEKEQVIEEKEQAIEEKEQAIEGREETLKKTHEKVTKTNEAINELKDIEKKLGNMLEFMEQISDADTLSILNSLPQEILDKATSDTPNFTNDEIKQIITVNVSLLEHLSQPGYIEKNILPQAQKNGNVESVSASLISLNPKYEIRINAFLLGESLPKKQDFPAEQQIRVESALLGKEESQKSGNIFSLDLGKNGSIDYDVVSGSRTMELDGYRLESQIPDVGDWQGPKLKYMKQEQATLPKLKKLANAAEMISSEMISSGEVAKILGTIKKGLGMTYFNKLKLGNSKSGQEIQDKLRIEYNKNNNKLTKARSEYTEALETLQAGHIATIKEKDEKVRETLKYFQSIGFTEIPQYITDQVVGMLNSDAAFASSLGFNEKIDFADGQLGIDSNAGEGDGIDLQDKIKFAEFVNKMLGFSISDENPPINVGALSNGSAPVGDREKFKTILLESGLLDVGGFGKIISNLSLKQE